jgi:hypothetical protein
LPNALGRQKKTMPRVNIKSFKEIPNVGKATEKYLNVIGINNPDQLIGKDPYKMYNELCKRTMQKHDPCVIDVFISAVRYMEGGSPKKWWEFTEERKHKLSAN